MLIVFFQILTKPQFVIIERVATCVANPMFPLHHSPPYTTVCVERVASLASFTAIHNCLCGTSCFSCIIHRHTQLSVWNELLLLHHSPPYTTVCVERVASLASFTAIHNCLCGASCFSCIIHRHTQLSVSSELLLLHHSPPYTTVCVERVASLASFTAIHNCLCRASCFSCIIHRHTQLSVSSELLLLHHSPPYTTVCVERVASLASFTAIHNCLCRASCFSCIIHRHTQLSVSSELLLLHHSPPYTTVCVERVASLASFTAIHNCLCGTSCFSCIIHRHTQLSVSSELLLLHHSPPYTTVCVERVASLASFTAIHNCLCRASCFSCIIHRHTQLSVSSELLLLLVQLLIHSAVNMELTCDNLLSEFIINQRSPVSWDELKI